MYRIAEVSSYGQYSLTEEFANYNISLDPSDQSRWRVLAETLSGYAARDMHSPVREGKTDNAGGACVFGAVRRAVSCCKR